MGELIRCDVAVIGGGIAGAACAVALEAAGFDVRLIERGSAPRPFSASGDFDPRVYAIAPRSAAFLERIRAWRQVTGKRLAPIGGMHVWDRDPERGLNFSASGLGAAGALGWIVEHGLLASSIWRCLPEVLRIVETEVVDAELDERRARLKLSSGDVIEAALAIGAEGAESPLRAVAGIEVSGWNYAQSAIVCHAMCSRPHGGDALQRFVATGPIALLPLPDGRRSLVWSTDDAEARALLELDDAGFSARLTAAMQGAAGEVQTVTRRLSFPLRLLHANDYVATRFALVGDSAHVIHPLAGQGLNLGLADAEVLAQVLSEARDAGRDWTAMRTLRRYERARQADNLEMIALTDALNRAFRSNIPGLQTLLSGGLSLVDAIPPVKRALVRRAEG